MPIYEYSCAACGGRTTVLTLRASDTAHPRCEHCGGTRLARLPSRPARVRSAATRFDALSDASGVDADDPRAVGRWVRDLGQELAPDAGEDFAEMAEEIAAGDEPEDGDP